MRYKSVYLIFKHWSQGLDNIEARAWISWHLFVIMPKQFLHSFCCRTPFIYSQPLLVYSSRYFWNVRENNATRINIKYYLKYRREIWDIFCFIRKKWKLCVLIKSNLILIFLLHHVSNASYFFSNCFVIINKENTQIWSFELFPFS